MAERFTRFKESLEAGIEEGDEIIRSAVERAKMKFQIVPKRLLAAKAKKEALDDSMGEGLAADGEELDQVRDKSLVQCSLNSILHTPKSY